MLRHEGREIRWTEWAFNTNTNWFNSHHVTIRNKAQQPPVILSESLYSRVPIMQHLAAESVFSEENCLLAMLQAIQFKTGYLNNNIHFLQCQKY
jgi:hypothetical protein